MPGLFFRNSLRLGEGVFLSKGPTSSIEGCGGICLLPFRWLCQQFQNVGFGIELTDGTAMSSDPQVKS